MIVADPVDENRFRTFAVARLASHLAIHLAIHLASGLASGLASHLGLI